MPIPIKDHGWKVHHNPFELLGLTKEASEQEVISAYMMLVRQYEPGTSDYHTLRAAYQEARLLTSSAPACEACNGKGKVSRENGMFTQIRTCFECGGSGKRKE